LKFIHFKLLSYIPLQYLFQDTKNDSMIICDFRIVSSDHAEKSSHLVKY